MKEANINKGRHESSCRYLANYFEQLSCSKRRRRWPKREGGRGIPEAVAVTLATGAHLIKAPDPLE